MIFMKKWKSLWIWIFCVHMLIEQWIWIASLSADKEEPSGIFLFKASGHNTAVCFKWFSFSGGGLTDLLQRRIWGDFMRIPRILWQKITPTLIFHFLIIWAERMLHSGMKWSCFILWNDSGTMLHLKRRFMKHFVSCTPPACQAHKSMKQSFGLWSTPVGVWSEAFSGFMFFCPKFGQKNGVARSVPTPRTLCREFKSLLCKYN